MYAQWRICFEQTGLESSNDARQMPAFKKLSREMQAMTRETAVRDTLRVPDPAERRPEGHGCRLRAGEERGRLLRVGWRGHHHS